MGAFPLISHLLVGLVVITTCYANLISELKQYAYTRSGSQNEEVTDKQNNGLLIPIPREVSDWPVIPLPFLGQISGVSINLQGHPVIFHRGKRVWEDSSFNSSFIFQKQNEGAIKDDTILTLDRSSGVVIESWGANTFYLPHGLTVDHEGFIWVTDVALHQVFKFSPHDKKAVLTLGEAFTPGTDIQHFCMPTSTAIASDGQFFIADGYCNKRILKYDTNGHVTRVYPQEYEYLSFSTPHSLALLEDHDTLCVADRENMRVVCVDAELHYKPVRVNDQQALSIHASDLGRVFAISSLGELLFAVNGPTASIPVQGFTLSPYRETILHSWAPISGHLENPHDIAISPNGTELYVVEISPNRIWKFQTSQWVNLFKYTYAYMPLEK